MQLAIIIALPTIERNVVEDELPSNVTIIEEGNGRFFSTSDLDSCWTDVSDQRRISADLYEVIGALYCISPLGEINGTANVSIQELSFSGLLDWSGA